MQSLGNTVTPPLPRASLNSSPRRLSPRPERTGPQCRSSFKRRRGRGGEQEKDTQLPMIRPSLAKAPPSLVPASLLPFQRAHPRGCACWRASESCPKNRFLPHADFPGWMLGDILPRWEGRENGEGEAPILTVSRCCGGYSWARCVVPAHDSPPCCLNRSTGPGTPAAPPCSKSTTLTPATGTVFASQCCSSSPTGSLL